MALVAKTQCVHADEKSIGAIAGLSWQPLHAYKTKKQVSEIRESAEMADSKKYCLVVLKNAEGVEEATAGFLPNEYVEDDFLYKPKKFYSMAMIVAKKYPGKNVVIAWKLLDREDDQFALIVIEDGVPTLDKICDQEEALNVSNQYITGAIGDGNFELYSNSEIDFSSAHEIDAEFLFGEWPAEAKITAIPIDKKKLVVVAAIAVMAVVGNYFVSGYLEEQERLARLEAQKKADKRPDYLRALPSAMAAVGVDTKGLIAQVENLFPYPILADGWALEKIRCNTTSCYSDWKASGGYVEDLSAYLTNHTRVLNGNTGDKQTMEFKTVMTLTGPSDFMSLKAADKMVAEFSKASEVWKKAGTKIKADDKYQTYPGNYGQFGTGFGVQRAPVEVVGSREILLDFLNNHGDQIYWDNLEISVSLQSKKSPLEYKAKGHIYVYQ